MLSKDYTPMTDKAAMRCADAGFPGFVNVETSREIEREGNYYFSKMVEAHREQAEESRKSLDIINEHRAREHEYYCKIHALMDELHRAKCEIEKLKQNTD